MAKGQKKADKVELDSAKAQKDKPLSEMVIKEIMVQKGVDRDGAIEILNNPTTGKDKR